MTDLPTWLVPATAIISSLACLWQSPEVHGDLSSNITNLYLNLKISNYIWLVPIISNYSRVIFMSSIYIWPNRQVFVKILWRYNIWLKITDLQINPKPPMKPLGFVQYNVIVVLALQPPGEWGRPSPLHQHLLPSALLVWPLHISWTQSEQHCTFE